MSAWLGPEPAASLLVVPAIDLLGGRVVRLHKGRYDRATEYGESPGEAARRFADAGAPAIHVVDLDGARAGSPVNLTAVEAIARAAPAAAVQLGGGVRDAGSARSARSAGASAVIVGSRAVREPGWLARLIDALGAGAVIGALDLRGEEIALEGWTGTADGTTPAETWRAWIEAGLERAIVTDTTRDGTMEGVETARYAPFLGDPVAVAAAGGLAGPADLDALASAGLAAAVAGRALYEGGLGVETLAQRGWRWRAG